MSVWDNLVIFPPGYGEPGPGRAVFSVSAFMDALPAETPVAPL